MSETAACSVCVIGMPSAGFVAPLASWTTGSRTDAGEANAKLAAARLPASVEANVAARAASYMAADLTPLAPASPRRRARDHGPPIGSRRRPPRRWRRRSE